MKTHRAVSHTTKMSRTKVPPTVELITLSHKEMVSIVLRSLRSQRTLFQRNATDLRGTELAVLSAERYCIEHGFVLVMPANDTQHQHVAA
jgi:hypothetical protein